MSTVVAWHPGVILPRASLTRDIVAAIQVALSPAQTLAVTAWAEGRSRLEPGRGWVSNPLEAQIDILNVIDNRVKDRRWMPLGHKGVCLQRRQFSCWDTVDGADNFFALLQRAQRMLAGELDADPLLAAAEGCVVGALADSLTDATHYYAPASMMPPGRVPAWVAGATLSAERFGHRFYRHVA